jgi:Zn-dependent peptidase ImmA (M78 family)
MIMLDTARNSRELDGLDDGVKAIIKKHLQSVPVKLGPLADELGIEVRLSSLPTGISGQIARKENGYLIKVNRHESRERQRFTVAHEIAHFLLHREIIDAQPEGIMDNVLYRSGNAAQIEYEANRLAADLVMPRNLVDSELGKFGGALSEEALEQLAERFAVSKAAMEIRVIG